MFKNPEVIRLFFFQAFGGLIRLFVIEEIQAGASAVTVFNGMQINGSYRDGST